MSSFTELLSGPTDIAASGLGVLVALIATVAGYAASAMLRKVRLDEERRFREISEVLSLSLKKEQAEISNAVAHVAGVPASPEEMEAAISQGVQKALVAANAERPSSLQFVGELVESYHRQALSQAQFQFWFSVIAASIGFVFVLATFFSANPEAPSSYLKVLPGAVVDVVALLFLRQAEQTRERATALYDRLRLDSQSERSNRLVEQITDPALQSLVRAQLALHLGGLTPKEIDLQAHSRAS